ncbi:CoxG family protein [Streptacidiphilus cavernicola]|uniref:CoxG family protein n=1 Tax=Streptacidiphilus cavernicola TaxID=3342716 RepID=A0ABV6VXD8_9ACTN
MEHEVLVPLPQHTVRRALRRPDVLARCLPGFTAQEPAGQEGHDLPLLAGRLKLRVGSNSITYRSELRLTGDAGDSGDADPVFLIRAVQSVGSGEVAGTLQVSTFTEGPVGTRIVFRGDFGGKGRIEDLPPQALVLAARRLLDRFCAAMTADPEVTGGLGPGVVGGADESYQPIDLGDLTDLADLTDLGDLADLSDLSDLADLADLEVPDESGLFMIEEPAAFNAAAALNEPWPEAPGNRRSIVGRSAEEVDHAPPSGRYGPALPPRSARSRAAARWGSPERRMGEPPSADVEHSRLPWVVGGGVALLGGAVILVRTIRRRG